MLDISQDIHSLSEFKRNTGQLVDQMRDTGHPLVLTINGRAELVVQDAATYQKQVDRMDELETLLGERKGLADVEAGRVKSLDEFRRSFRAKRHATSGLPPNACSIKSPVTSR